MQPNMFAVTWVFTLVKFYGLWKPTNWANDWRSRLYDTYSCFVVVTLSSYCVLNVVFILKSFEDLHKFIDDTFIFITSFGVFCKFITFLVKRSRIIYAAVILQREVCRPRDAEEISIKRKFDTNARTLTVRYASILGILFSILLIFPLLEDLAELKFTNQPWVPCDQPTLTQFIFVYAGVFFVHTTFGATELLLVSLVAQSILQICTQIELLKHRLRIIGYSDNQRLTRNEEGQKYNREVAADVEKKHFIECIQHHNTIFELAAVSNNNFAFAIFLQFTLTLLVMCAIILQLAKLRIGSLEFVFSLIYLGALILQIFLFCWYGNKVTVESLDVANAAYDADWMILSKNTKKCLLMIMARSTKPILFRAGHVVVLSLESFSSLMKLSYSTYNVIAQSKEL